MSLVVLEDTDSQLAQLVQQASNGEEIIIVRGTVAVAKIVPMLPDAKASSPLTEEEPKPKRSGYGSAKGKILYMADDFDAPLEDFKDYM